MPGTITRFAIAQSTAFGLLPNGNEYAIHFDSGPFGDSVWAAYIRWTWDFNFTPVTGGEVASSDLSACEDILTTGGLWDTDTGLPAGAPTWRQILAGAGFIAKDGNTYSGTAGISRGLGDFLSGLSPAVAEQATIGAYWANELSIINSSCASAFGALTTPPAPAPPKTPSQLFPPQLVGAIPSALTLAGALGTLVAAMPAGNIPVVGHVPIPQS